MKFDRRDFLKGTAAAYISTHIPANVYGLSADDAKLIFPPNPTPGTEFRVRVHGHRTLKWPDNVVWQRGVTPVASGGADLLTFRTIDNGRQWYGSAVQDFR